MVILLDLLLELEFFRFLPSDLSKVSGSEDIALCATSAWSPVWCTKEETERVGSILLTTMLMCLIESVELPGKVVRPEGSILALVPLFVLCTDIAL